MRIIARNVQSLAGRVVRNSLGRQFDRQLRVPGVETVEMLDEKLRLGQRLKPHKTELFVQLDRVEIPETLLRK
jgi:hypothetical protein